MSIERSTPLPQGHGGNASCVLCGVQLQSHSQRRTALYAIRVVWVWLAAFIPSSDAAESAELPIAHDEYVYMIRFSPDGKTLATAAGDNVVRVWNWSTRELLYTLEHDAAVYAAVFSASKDLLATGSGDGKVTLWKASTGQQIAQRQEHADAIYCLSFAPDGMHLASIGGDGKRGDTLCRTWSIPSLNITRVLPSLERPGYGVLFGPRTSGGRDKLVTSGGDALIRIYVGQTYALTTLKGHTSDVYRCCFSPDGEQLASTSQDGSVRLWNVSAGKLITTIFQAKTPTYDVTYSGDGRILVAVGDDGFVRFWSVKTYELLAESKMDNEGLYSVVFTPGQASVITGGVRGKVYELAAP